MAGEFLPWTGKDNPAFDPKTLYVPNGIAWDRRARIRATPEPGAPTPEGEKPKPGPSCGKGCRRAAGATPGGET